MMSVQRGTTCLLLCVVLFEGAESFSVNLGPTATMYRFQKSTRLDGVTTSSLASDFLVQVEADRWAMYPINNIVTEPAPDGQRAMTALYDIPRDNLSSSLMFSLHSSESDGKVTIKVEGTADDKLVAVLSRIMVQASGATSVVLPGEPKETTVNNLQSEEGVLQLFEPIIGSTESIELSEMVDRSGKPIGMVPRKLVHAFNLLHRGIGMVVAKDKPILTPGTKDLPDLYVHRRTDAKRIFPSLYDMFVGGISTAKEDPKVTAAREVSEELGLSRALSDPSSLSDPLFDCTVCTSYNRCFVTMFCYTFDGSKEDSISWQEEEVAWGEFCDYDTIVASANLSIQRLVEVGKWPAKEPLDLPNRVQKSQEHGKSGAWREWDYVPDGLLVWEAWLEWQNRDQK